MSIKYLNDAWALPLNSSEKILMLAIADAANDDGYCYPSYKNLMQKTGMAKATLSKQLKILKDIGLIKSESHGDIGQGKKVNTYTISLRGELPISSDIELIGKIKDIRKKYSAPISSVLSQRKVQPSDTISSQPEHEPSLKPSLKQPSLSNVVDHLAKKILSHTPTSKLKPESWLKDIDLAMRFDKRKESDLIQIIDWIYADGSFWIPHVRSGKKLREKYDTMFAQKLTGNKKRQTKDFSQTDYSQIPEGFNQ